MISIKENFLSEDLFAPLKEKIVDQQSIAFYYNKDVAHTNESREDFYFTHIIYDNHKPNSDLFEKMTPILKKLKVTKQSLNRVLRDLIKSKMIKQIQDENDTRKKNLFLDKEGKIFFESVYNSQKKRIFNALKNSSSDSVIKFKNVLKKIYILIF